MDDNRQNTGTGAKRPVDAQRLSSWIAELRRRHIFKVTIAYLVLAWLLMQVAAVLESSLKLPDWIDTATFAFLVIGFPFVLFVTWAVNLGPDNGNNENKLSSTPSSQNTPDSYILQTDEIFRRPSIAVLPFNDMSGDPQQEFFVDGLTEDIITALSRCKSFPVIARNSTFSYKGQSPDVRKVAKELGASYVLEGSVRKSDDQLRVNVQLINGGNGEHVWAEKYDRKIENLFNIQDDIVEAIVGTLQPELGKAEQHRATLQQPENLDAWYAFQRGMWHYQRRTKNDSINAVRYFEKSIELAPHFSQAYSGLAITKYFMLIFNWTDFSRELSDEILTAARKAVENDPDDSMAYTSLGLAYIGRNEPSLAVPALEKAIQIDPNNFMAPQMLGAALVCSGNAKKATSHLERALRLSPRDPLIATTYSILGQSYYFAEEQQLAESAARKAMANRLPTQVWVALGLIAILADSDKLTEAKTILNQLMAEHPYLSCEYVRNNTRIVDKEYLKKYMGSLRKSGLQEKSPNL